MGILLGMRWKTAIDHEIAATVGGLQDSTA
jgi:hypothetical protein